MHDAAPPCQNDHSGTVWQSPPRRTTCRRANRCGETGSSSPQGLISFKIRRAATDRAAFAGRQLDRLEKRPRDPRSTSKRERPQHGATKRPSFEAASATVSRVKSSYKDEDRLGSYAVKSLVCR